jgi:hypothetical protein
MQIEWLDVVKVVGGGGAGAILSELFRRLSTRTREALLIERVNRQQLELRGIRLVRQNAGDGQEREIKNLRTHQFTLYNASGFNLRSSQIQFEFSSDDVQAWVDRPARSRTALIPVDAVLTPPWKTALRWQIPSLPQRDSIEFSFDVFEPSTEDYEPVLYSDVNVVLRKTRGEPEQPPGINSRHLYAMMLFPLLLVGALSFGYWVSRGMPREDSHERLIHEATVALDEADKAPTEHDRATKLERALRLLIKAISDNPPPIPPGG